MNTSSRFICLSGRPEEDRELVEFGPGDTVLHAPSCTFVRTRHGDDLELTLPPISRVLVDDPSEVVNQSICVDDDDGLLHTLEFSGGSWARINYDCDRSIVGLDGYGLKCHFEEATGVFTILPGVAVTLAPPASTPTR